jgi:hypothetical protein
MTAAALGESAVAGSPPNPSGICMCGCGETTPLAKKTRHKTGTVRGEHLRFCHGHTANGIRPACDPTTLTPCPRCEEPMHRGSSIRCAQAHSPGSASACKPCSRGSKKVVSDAAPSAGIRGRSGVQRLLDPVQAVEEWAHFGEVLGYTTSAVAARLGYSPDGLRRVIEARTEKRPDDPHVASFLAAWAREHPISGGD